MTNQALKAFVDVLKCAGYTQTPAYQGPSEHLAYHSGDTCSVLFVDEKAPTDVPRTYTLHDWS